MKIYQINSVCGYGSTGRIMLEMYEFFLKQGHQCRLAYGRGKAPNGINAFKIASKWEVCFHVIMVRLFDRHGLHSHNGTKKLIQDIVRYKPDVIQLHNIHGYYVDYEILFDFFKSYGKPIVWTLHDCWAFTGHCAYYDAAGCVQWKTECKKCPNLRDYPMTLFKGNVANNYRRKKSSFSGIKNLTLVTPSFWLRDEVNKSFLKEYEIMVIPNGIDTKIFKPINWEGMRYILGVANEWSPRKGFDDFIYIAKKLGQEYKVVLVGVTEKQISKLPANVTGIERTSDVYELAKIYSQAMVLLNPTYEDNLPTVNIEALACGTPVITYDTGGSMEVLTDATGICVEKGNRDLMLSKLKDINKLSRKECRQRGELYDKEVRFKEFVDLYRVIIDKDKQDKRKNGF